MVQLKEHGIRNVLALRGDPPKGQDSFVQVEAASPARSIWSSISDKSMETTLGLLLPGILKRTQTLSVRTHRSRTLHIGRISTI